MKLSEKFSAEISDNSYPKLIIISYKISTVKSDEMIFQKWNNY